MYTFQSESTLYSFLNVKELLAWNKHDTWYLTVTYFSILNFKMLSTWGSNSRSNIGVSGNDPFIDISNKIRCQGCVRHAGVGIIICSILIGLRKSKVDIWFQNCSIASIVHELEELMTQTGCNQIYCSIYKMFGNVLKNMLMQFPKLGSPGIQRLSIATCWINICINHKPMRPKILSNWLADFQKILVTYTPYFQEIWQLLCCWSEYA